MNINNVPSLEYLEERIVPDGDPLGNPIMPPPLPPMQVQVTLNNGTLAINGTDENDDILIKLSVNGTVQVLNKQQVLADFNPNLLNWVNASLKDGNDKFVMQELNLPNVTLWVNGDDGADEITSEVCPSTIDGGVGNDTLRGSNTIDVIWGGDGDDLIYGRGAADILSGGQNNDIIWGGDGADLIWGGDGDDTLIGEMGADKIYGENGVDSLYGNTHPNQFGGVIAVLPYDFSYNELYGGEGNDALFCDRVGSANFYSGGAGNDIIHGEGLDGAWLQGGSGNDFIYSNLDISKTNYIEANDGEIDSISTSGFDVIDDDVIDLYI